MSEASDERTPGLSNNKLTGKLIAAVIFVIVGTVVVAYSMNYCKECEEVAQVDENDVLVSDSTKPASELAPSLQLKTVTTPKSNNPVSLTNPAKPNNGSGQFKVGSAKIKPVSSELPKSQSFSQAKPKNFGGFQRTQKQNALKAPVQEKLGGTTPVNQFQKLKSQTNQFAGDAAKVIKQAPSDFSAKTSNALRKFGDRAGELAQGVKGAVQKQTNSAFAPGRSNTANNTKPSNSLPPITPGNSSFNRSQESKSFGGSNTTTVKAPTNKPNPFSSRSSQIGDSGSKRLQTPSSLAPINSRAQSPRNPSALQTKQASKPRQLSNPLTSRSSTPATGVTTAPTPGDRLLEGIQSPSVTIEKIAPREIQVNQPADFQLVVKNTGRIAAKGVRVFDQIPAGTELVQSTPQPSRGPNNQISWDLDTLDPGQEKTIRIQLKPTRPGEIGSVAQVTFSAQASMRTKVTKPVLAIRHTTEPRVMIGDKVILNIDVKNEGDGAAKDVIIQEDLPAELEFSEGFRELEYAIGTLGPGQSRKVQLELRAAKIGKCRNVLVAHANGGLQTQHAVDLEVIAPSLVATGEGPTKRYLKREATHRFAVRNNGTAEAMNVELVCRLPSGLRFVSTNNRGKYDENSHSVYWSLAQLDVGLVANVEVTTVPTEPGNQDLKLDVVADLNQTTSAICKLNVEHLTDIFFDIDDVVDPIEIGNETSYKLRIVNQGTKTATNVQLQVDFPQGIQPTGVDGNVTANIRGQQIAFVPITSMNPGDTIEITIRGKGITAGDHRIAANLIADGREVNVSKQESTRVYSDR